jgi:hypothetical protein
MIITDIHGENVKIGKSSITVKGDNGKTKGIVTNCKAFSAMSPADKMQLRKAGISLDESRNCIIQNGNIYYLHNTHFENWIKQQKHPEIFARELATVERLRNTAEAMHNKGITVIECVIE